MAGNAGGTGKPSIDSTVPHSARIWNYWLGGKDNYPADRMAGEQTIAVLPEIVDIARASRAFLVRVVSRGGQRMNWLPAPGFPLLPARASRYTDPHGNPRGSAKESSRG